MRFLKKVNFLAVLVALLLVAAACGGDDAPNDCPQISQRSIARCSLSCSNRAT